MPTGIKFVYNEPAMVIHSGKDHHLVVGDLHIGVERNLHARGVHVFNATDFMAERIKKIMKEFSLKKIIMLGDIKETVLYPDTTSARLIKEFFSQLQDFEITVVAGNHDAHLGDIVDLPMTRELVLDGFALLHGDKNPSESAMQSDYIITAHNHAMVRITDKNGAVYDEKVWFISRLDWTAAHETYTKANKKIKLIVMPAFNSLITGTEISRFYKESASPLLRNRIFKYDDAEIYNLAGQRIDITALRSGDNTPTV
jgi:putative SbcD/Mre11-related phosphoesterase